MWGILSSSTSESAGVVGFEKAGYGGGTAPSFGEAQVSQTTGGVLGGASPAQRLACRPWAFSALRNWTAVVTCGSRVH